MWPYNALRGNAWEIQAKLGTCGNLFVMFSDKNVLQLLYIIAHEIMVSNSVSEYTHGPWHGKVARLSEN